MHGKRRQERQKHGVTLLLTLLLASLAGCAGRAYVYDEAPLAGLRDAAQTQADGGVTVAAAVPGRDQAAALFGVDLYAEGIQPVWLEVRNDRPDTVRYAPVSTDHDYFSPLEVAWKFRRGYSDEAEFELQKRLYLSAMPRYIRGGETRSGFVFTHLDNGAKGFNVDVHAAEDSQLFTFLLRVPGFTPDYANIDFQTIYAESDIRDLDDKAAYEALKRMPCCTTRRDGGERLPINVMLIASGGELLSSLLRSGWLETPAEESRSRSDEYFFGRPQDAIFRYETLDRGSTYELRLWFAPVLADGEHVWLGQVRHNFRIGGLRRQDADIDNARNFAAQRFIYGQAVERIAWFQGPAVVPVERLWERLTGESYFTDGSRIVLWVSGDPAAAQDIDFVGWDDPPMWKQ